jgi:hypothetical protein
MTRSVTLHLPLGLVLTVVADAGSSGTVDKLSDAAGGVSNPPVAISASSTRIFGPFYEPTRFSINSDTGQLGVSVDYPVQSTIDDCAELTATAMPAGGTGSAAGGWDTAQHRDAAIAAFAAALADLTALRSTVNSILAQLRLTGGITR